MIQRGTPAWHARNGALGCALVALACWAWRSAQTPGGWQRVLATREGLVGGRMASGIVIRPESRFVALPHPSALGRSVELRYRARSMIVPVLDVGPWNVNDPYWRGRARPAAERGVGAYRSPTNQAGIDLSDAVFRALGMKGNDFVEWRFVDRRYVPLPAL